MIKVIRPEVPGASRTQVIIVSETAGQRLKLLQLMQDLPGGLPLGADGAGAEDNGEKARISFTVKEANTAADVLTDVFAHTTISRAAIGPEVLEIEPAPEPEHLAVEDIEFRVDKATHALKVRVTFSDGTVLRKSGTITLT